MELLRKITIFLYKHADSTKCLKTFKKRLNSFSQKSSETNYTLVKISKLYYIKKKHVFTYYKS